MVVPTQGLTSLSRLAATPAGLKERMDASLVRTSSAEPLNAMVRLKPSLSPVGIGEGKRDFDGEAAIGRIPVISADGTPLMPCKPAKARKLLRDGKAVKKWSKLGMFSIQLKFNPRQPAMQPLAVGVDSGSKFEGFSVVGKKDTVLNIMLEAVGWVRKALERRRRMRRARRYRKTRCRACRFDNRLRSQRRGLPPPSTKARWDAKLRIIKGVKRIVPMTLAVVEDVKAETKPRQRRWNRSFSPLEVGKQYFYSQLSKMGLEVITKTGVETKRLREWLGLQKIGSKSNPVFESHCIDAWVLASSETGAGKPSTKSLYYVTPLKWHRRQLHRLEPERGSVRKRYGGTLSLGFKKGTLVKHTKYGFCYIGGNLKGRFSLHSLTIGRRLTQDAKREDFKVLTRLGFRTQFLPRFQSGVPLGCFSTKIGGH